jgi:CBS domain-containing protein
MVTVSQLLKTKGHHVWCIGPQAFVYDALKLMAEQDIGALVVTADERVVGIFSERDYARKIILLGRSSKTTTVAEIMIRNVVIADPEKTVEECMALMTAKRVRHLPVMSDQRLVGLVSIGDLVKAIIAEQEFVIAQLENYIYGLPSSG